MAEALAGLRGNEARYFKNKYDHGFTVEPASQAKGIVDHVHHILKAERDIKIASPPLDASQFRVDDLRWSYVFYESGLSINVLYSLDPAGKRAVGLSSPRVWTCRRSSRRSSSPARNPSWPERSAARTP